MAQDETVENRVYLFESLASSYVASASELLSSKDEAVRARALRALADLAFVSCVVADTGHLPPEQVRERLLDAAREPAPVSSQGRGRRRRPREE
ncbi:MAG: hypothetical protein ABW123_29645 [Cystobacter sp.]